MLCVSEYGIVTVRITAGGACVCGSLLLLQVLLDPIAVDGPQGIAQLVEQFEHGKRLLRCPSVRDENTDRERCCHDLAPRRWRARCSVRTRASLRR